MITKWLHPDAKHADVGNAMEAYYDETAKRWIFPGDDPAEAAGTAPPSAPPTKAELSSGPPLPIGGPPPGGSGAGEPGPAANDPLAALMAPPKSLSSLPTGRYGRAGGIGGGGGKAGAGPPSSALGGGAPPIPAKYTVFSPQAPPPSG
ncbi:unnamed protein product [Discosporangium mesarthrocarpum]